MAVVTINNPPMNQLSAALLEELEAEIERLDGDDGTRAIVLRGGGERAFVAGADIKEFPALRESAASTEWRARRAGSRSVGHRMDAARKPFVAAIQGYCLGGGLELAMCCDVRVCADDAQLGQPEIKLGLIPGGGGTQRLPRLVGPGARCLMNLGGEFIDAATAYDWGLVEKVVPRAELDAGGARDRADVRRALAACDRGAARARAHDARSPARGRAAPGGGGLPALSRQRGRAGRRRGVHREARAELHRPLVA